MAVARFRHCFVIALLTVAAGVAAAGQSPDAGYQALVKLFSDFVSFERPPLLNGAPDYSAATTAASLAAVLATHGLANTRSAAGSVRLLATDGPERFARVGAVFLGRELAARDVEIVDLPYIAVPA